MHEEVTTKAADTSTVPPSQSLTCGAHAKSAMLRKGGSKRAVNWSARETEKLIELRWSDPKIVKAFLSTREAKDREACFNMIAARLESRTGLQVKNRLRTITGIYQVLQLIHCI